MGLAGKAGTYLHGRSSRTSGVCNQEFGRISLRKISAIIHKAWNRHAFRRNIPARQALRKDCKVPHGISARSGGCHSLVPCHRYLRRSRQCAMRFNTARTYFACRNDRVLKHLSCRVDKRLDGKRFRICYACSLCSLGGRNTHRKSAAESCGHTRALHNDRRSSGIWAFYSPCTRTSS